MKSFMIVCVLLAAVVGVCVANVHHHSNFNQVLRRSHPAQLEDDDSNRLVELEHELEDLNKQLVIRRYLEEHPKIEDAYNEYATLDLKLAMCSLTGLGRNFAICVENEAYSVNLYGEKVSVVVNVVLGVLGLGAIKSIFRTVTKLATHDYPAALDEVANLILHGVGDPTGPIRHLIAGLAQHMDSKYMVCAICAMALAWAIANGKAALSAHTAASIHQALAYAYEKKKPAAASNKLCPLSAGELLEIGTLSRDVGARDEQERVTNVLRAIAESYITALANNVVRHLAIIAEPFGTLMDSTMSKAQQMALNIDDPSTERMTPMEKGGWLVEDLTDDYFTDASNPITHFEPSFKYRDCQRACDVDIRGAARECSRSCDRTCSGDCSVL